MNESSRRQFLSFHVGEETCALDVAHLREIVRIATVTRVPNAHASVRGVVNLRGSVLPVIDAACLLGLRPAATTGELHLVIVEAPVPAGMAVIGLAVDSVSEAFHAESEQIEASPAFGTRIPLPFLAGIVKRDGLFISLLDLAGMLSENTFGRRRGNAA